MSYCMHICCVPEPVLDIVGDDREAGEEAFGAVPGHILGSC